MTTYSAQDYYNLPNRTNDLESTERPLTVNCCGIATVPTRTEKRVNSVMRRDFYLMYMISGELQAELGGEAFLLKSGSFICIPPRTPYVYNCVSAETAKYFWIHFTGSEAREVLTDSGISPLTQYYTGGMSETAEIYERLFSEFRNRTEHFVYRAALLLRNVLVSLSDNCVGEEAEKNTLDSSLKYVHTHIGEEITVKRLAEMEYMSEGYYRVLFKRITGASPGEYIATQRINRACQLLTETTQSIDNIAQSVGIRDRLYFQRFFKKHIGITPSKYREKTTAGKCVLSLTENTQ